MTTSGEAPWVPVEECTLPSAEQPLRVAEFDDLFAETLTRVARQGPTRALLRMVGEPGLPSLVQGLVDREAACCSFFTFTVTTFHAEALSGSPEVGVHLEVEVPETRADVLSALVGRADIVLDASTEPVDRPRS